MKDFAAAVSSWSSLTASMYCNFLDNIFSLLLWHSQSVLKPRVAASSRSAIRLIANEQLVALSLLEELRELQRLAVPTGGHSWDCTGAAPVMKAKQAAAVPC